jgi:Flp pilus assembly protein TadD
MRAGHGFLVVLAAVALAAGCRGSSVPPPPPNPTFSRDIAPILFAQCASCHRAGQPVPFTLLTYEDAARYAPAIADAVAARRMPPWLPDPIDPPLVGEQRLTDAQIQLLQRWAQTGAPQGDPREAPAAPTWSSGWQLGEPDLVVTAPRPFVLQPGAHDAYRNLVLPVTLPANRFVRAVEFRAGTSQVHHAVIRIDRTQSSRARDGADGQPGFDGMVAYEVQDPEGHFLGWAPGRGPIVAPADMPWRLDRGSDLIVELHLIPGDAPSTVQPSIGLFFTDTPPTKNPVLMVMGSKAIDIPPGEANYAVEDAYQLPVDVDLLSIYPHAHYLGKEMRIDAELPGGSRRSLLHIPRWDFHWQRDYQYSAPVPLPRGTTIRMRYTYDNSASNPANPHGAPRRVTWGPQSSDEMGNLGLQVLPRSPDDARRLVASFETHAAQSDLDGAKVLLSVDAHAGNETLVGSSYVRLGRPAEALPHLQRALRLDPKSSNAANFLAGALLALGRSAEAVAQFRQATALAPRDEHLRFNLARALQAQGDRAGAIRELQRALGLNRDFADAHLELGVLLFEDGRLREAISHLLEATRLAPMSGPAHSALGGALAQAGQRDQAVIHLRQALALNPADDAARQNLSLLSPR